MVDGRTMYHVRCTKDDVRCRVFGMVIVQQERGEENNTYIYNTSYGCAAYVGAAEETIRSRLSATD